MCSRIALFAMVVAALVAPARASAQSTRTGPALGVARISVVSGDVATMRGNSGDWVTATVNMPVVEGDSVQSGIGSRTEIQLDHGNFVRLWNDTQVQLLELASQNFRLRVIQGTVIYSELPDSVADIDIETPLAAVRPMKSGRYRITAGPGEVIVTVRQGRAEVALEATVSTLASGRAMAVREGSDGPEVETSKASPQDALDKWAAERDKELRRARSYRYLSRDIYGADTLDDHGNWRYVAGVGYSWFPRAATGWVPYRHGRWIWIDYYGWTWVGSEPWGWAPYHWGRWYRHAAYGWGWYPGAPRLRHVWRPALVAFFGFEAAVRSAVWGGFGGIGWCPLAPGEAFVPWYGRRYYAGGNTILVDNSVNIYNNYRNARGYRGVSYVNAQDFGRGVQQTPRSLRIANTQTGVAIRGPVPVVPARSSQGRLVQSPATSASALRSLRTNRPGALRDGTVRVSFESQQERLRSSIADFRSTYKNPAIRARSGTSARSAPSGGSSRPATPAARSSAAAGTRSAVGNPATPSSNRTGVSPAIRTQRSSGTRAVPATTANPGVRARSATVRTARPVAPATSAGTGRANPSRTTTPGVFVPRTRSRIGALNTARGTSRTSPRSAAPATPASSDQSRTTRGIGARSRSSRSAALNGSDGGTRTSPVAPVGGSRANRIGTPTAAAPRSPTARPPTIRNRTASPGVGATRSAPPSVFAPRSRSRVGSATRPSTSGSGSVRRPPTGRTGPSFGSGATRGSTSRLPSSSRVPAVGSRGSSTSRRPAYSPNTDSRSRSTAAPSARRTAPQVRTPSRSRSSGGGYNPSRSRIGSTTTGRSRSTAPSARSPASPRPSFGGSRSSGAASRSTARSPSSSGTSRSNAGSRSSSARSSSASSARGRDR